LLALLAFVWHGHWAASPDTALHAEVSVGRQVVWVAPFTGESATFEYGGVRVAFSFGAGAAGFVSSNCPDQICVHTGWLHLPGQMAVCVPNRTALLIVGEHRPGHIPTATPDTFAY